MVKEEVAALHWIPGHFCAGGPMSPEIPTLPLLAKRCLAVRAASVPRERLFSMVEDIVSASSSALSANNVDMLLSLSKTT